MRDVEGRNPTIPQAEAGERSELTVSVPQPTSAKRAAIAAAVPPDEPPGVLEASYGFRVWPRTEERVIPWRANSWRFALPIMIAPAALRRVRIVLCVWVVIVRALTPAVVGRVGVV